MPVVCANRIHHVKGKICNIKIDRLPDQHLRLRSLPPSNNLSSHVDLRERFPPPYDQGKLGSCTANALCGLYAFHSPDVLGSRLFLYYNERKLENDIPDDHGALLSDGIKVLEQYGLCEEKDWPYDVAKFSEKPSDDCYRKALAHHVISAHNIANTLEEMRRSLQLGQPFVVGIMLFQSFESMEVAKTGMVPMPSQGEAFLGGHAVVCVGYDDERRVWAMRNSWGDQWGDRGYFYLPYDYLDNPQLSSDLWCITKVEKVEKQAVAKPEIKPVEKPVEKPEIKPVAKPVAKPAPLPAVIVSIIPPPKNEPTKAAHLPPVIGGKK